MVLPSLSIRVGIDSHLTIFPVTAVISSTARYVQYIIQDKKQFASMDVTQIILNAQSYHWVLCEEILHGHTQFPLHVLNYFSPFISFSPPGSYESGHTCNAGDMDQIVQCQMSFSFKVLVHLQFCF